MDDEISNRQKPSPAALAAIRDMLNAPLPVYRNARTKEPLKPEKERGAPTRHAAESLDPATPVPWFMMRNGDGEPQGVTSSTRIGPA